MAERYKRLFSLYSNLYEEGAPLLISAGALLKDNQTGRIISQLKFKSVSQKAIKAVKVKLFPLDTVNSPLGDAITHEYLDIYIKLGSDFGQKEPIVMPDTSTRAFKAAVTEVAFTDNSVWKGIGEEWKPFPTAERIIDSELLRQYKKHFGDSAVNLPVVQKGAWICACGSFNSEQDPFCRTCGNKLADLLACDIEELKAEKDKRLEEERAAAERRKAEERAAEERRIREEREAKEAKARRTKKALAITLPILALIAAAIVLTFTVFIPNSEYNKA